jgi:hypothetical protein
MRIRLKALGAVLRQIARWPGRVQIASGRGLFEVQGKILKHRSIPRLQCKEMPPAAAHGNAGRTRGRGACQWQEGSIREQIALDMAPQFSP